MIEEIFRNFFEIKSLNDLNEVQKPSKKYTLNVIKPKNFSKYIIIVVTHFVLLFSSSITSSILISFASK